MIHLGVLGRNVRLLHFLRLLSISAFLVGIFQTGLVQICVSSVCCSIVAEFESIYWRSDTTLSGCVENSNAFIPDILPR